jgi:hypothetical protein
VKNLLYYPGFEIEDEAWLKFALLYLDKLSTIVPHSAEEDLEDKHKLILKNTDLLGNYHPDYDESEKATDDAIEIIDKVLNNPARYWSRFGEVKYLEVWKNPRFHDFEIYREKYSHAFLYFCETNGFATRTQKGIKVPTDLGLIYMSLLAYSIKDNKGIDVITDSERTRRLRSVADKTWKQNIVQEKLTSIRSFIELQLPTDVRSIPIDSIVELRNKPSYRKKLKAFHEIVEKFGAVNTIDKFNIHELKKEMDYNIKDIGADIVVNFGATLATATLGTYMVIGDELLSMAQLKELVGIGFVIGGSIQMHQGITKLNSKRLARSYLTQLKGLKPRQSSFRMKPNKVGI